MPGAVLVLTVGDDAIDAGGVFFELVKGEVLMDEEKDHQRGADADGEAGDIDKGEGLVAAEAPQGDEEIVF
jgi:hypothetical protein